MATLNLTFDILLPILKKDNLMEKEEVINYMSSYQIYVTLRLLVVCHRIQLFIKFKFLIVLY